MIIEIPSKYLDNVLFFYKIYDICTSHRKKDVTLFINSSYDEIDMEKLVFLISVLRKISINATIIIDKNVPNYYENILFMSKLSKEINVDVGSINIKDIVNYLNCLSITNLKFDIYYFSTEIIGFNKYDNIIINCSDISKIKKVISSEDNIKLLIKVISLFEKNDIDYKNNFALLKELIIKNLNDINRVVITDKSSTVNLNKLLNEKVNFRRCE